MVKTTRWFLKRGAAIVALVVAGITAQPAYALSGYCITTDDGGNWSITCHWDIDEDLSIEFHAEGYRC